MRPAPRIPRDVIRAKRKPNPKRAALHLAYVRSLGICLACGQRGPMQAAHVRKGTDGGMGTKPGDRFTVCLCPGCHHEQHQRGELIFWSDLGVDAMNICLRLWTISGDVEAGQRVILRSLLTRHIA